ncbi:DUF2231 domain-containing protein [Nocardioides nematodiphilus]|uniref:DUF2231 domain-containing protein n=1 Tax=Nocardioides nematodiphilus TaxID=2849669 RepID=UPI001CDA1EDC|nr:DUF2231 domain-containing protein [Nocardioides nematodiphilus]MCA1982243.1 hypothetical protein [Nocardioides nematodiphilus]
MTINGLPLHPLVVHAAVVFAPLAGLLAIGYAVPRWRYHLRWPLLAVGVLAALFVWLAAATGDSLAHATSGEMATNPALAKAIHHHEDLAGKLQASTWVLAALALGAWWTHHRPGWWRTALLVLLPASGVAALVLVVLTGDAGARAVWIN